MGKERRTAECSNLGWERKGEMQSVQTWAGKEDGKGDHYLLLNLLKSAQKINFVVHKAVRDEHSKPPWRFPPNPKFPWQ